MLHICSPRPIYSMFIQCDSAADLDHSQVVGRILTSGTCVECRIASRVRATYCRRTYPLSYGQRRRIKWTPDTGSHRYSCVMYRAMRFRTFSARQMANSSSKKRDHSYHSVLVIDQTAAFSLAKHSCNVLPIRTQLLSV